MSALIAPLFPRLARAAGLALVLLPLQGCFTWTVLKKADSQVTFREPKVITVAPDGSVSFSTTGESDSKFWEFDRYAIEIPPSAIEQALQSGMDPQVIKWTTLPGVKVSRGHDAEASSRDSVCVSPETDIAGFAPTESIPLEINGQTVLVKLDYANATMRYHDAKWYWLVPVCVAGDAIAAPAMVVIGAAGAVLSTVAWIPLIPYIAMS